MAVVTIFGGSGFLASHLVPRLAKAGHRIRLAVRRPQRAESLKVTGTIGQVTPISCTITDESDIARALEGADWAINLVGILFPSGKQQSFHSIHAEGPGRIAKAAKAAGVKQLVHVSALGADAQSPSVYARTKALGEQALLSHFPKAFILRPSVVFGPEDQFVNRFAKMMSLSPAVPLIGGQNSMQPVYGGDVAGAIIACLEGHATSAKKGPSIYELGGPETLTFQEILQNIRTWSGQSAGFIPVPFPMAYALGRVLQWLPTPPLTADQVILLQKDAVVSGNYPGLAELGISAMPMKQIVPFYLDPYRPGGRFAAIKT